MGLSHLEGEEECDQRKNEEQRDSQVSHDNHSRRSRSPRPRAPVQLLLLERADLLYRGWIFALLALSLKGLRRSFGQPPARQPGACPMLA